MQRSLTDIIKETTEDYLKTIDMSNPPSPQQVQEELLEQTFIVIETENTLRAKSNKLKIPDRLTPSQIAMIVDKLYFVKRIAYGGLEASEEYDVLCIYQSEGDNEGIYTPSYIEFSKIITQYNFLMDSRQIRETMSCLERVVDRAERTPDRNLVAVNNGIFDYDTKQLMPFSPEYVFISKSKVNYNPSAVNKVITEPDGTLWDIESWIDDLFDGNKGLSDLIWQIIGAIIRPNVSWNKSAWFYSESGNNGKGTLCSLMRQIAGSGTYTSISLANFSKDFMLEPLTQSSCIIVDENDVGTYIDKAANLKAVITGDPIQINRKYKSAMAYQFKGFMVQCVNEMPRMKDKSESLARRLLIVPFTKCFTGAEKKYIKDEYLKDREVLEYALKKALESDYYELDEPQECKDALASYKLFNDPVREFAQLFLPQFVWNLVPYSFMFDLYKEWYKETYGALSNAKGKGTFIKDIKVLIQSEYSDTWSVPSDPVPSRNDMDEAEPLIHEYKLDKWVSPTYNGNEPEKKCHPLIKSSYRGIVRL